MPNTLVHYPSLAMTSVPGKSPTGGETFTVTCYMCGMPSSTEWAQRVLTRPVSPPRPFFPFLCRIKHAAGTYISQEDGSTFLCAFCHASLESQWNSFEKSDIPLRERHYNANNFICAVCAVETYRKRVRALPFQEFPFLAKERPAGSLTLGNNPLAVVCLDCSETLWAQSAEYDRWGLPVQKRHFNWMSRPPPPENSMEATVARLPSGETQLPRCPPTEPLVIRRKDSNIQNPIHDFNNHINIPSHSFNSHRPNRTSLCSSDKRHSPGSDKTRSPNSRKSSIDSLSETSNLIIGGPSVPIVTVAPMTITSTTTTSTTPHRKDLSNLMTVDGLLKLESQKLLQKHEFRSMNGYPPPPPALYPTSSMGYGTYGAWPGGGHLMEPYHPYPPPPLTVEPLANPTQWPWIHPMPNTDFARYQAYLSSIANNNFAHVVESYFSQTRPHPSLQSSEPIHTEQQDLSPREPQSRKRSSTTSISPTPIIPRVTRQVHQTKVCHKSSSVENSNIDKEHNTQTQLPPPPFKKRNFGKINQSTEVMDLSQHQEGVKKPNSNFSIANLCSENMSPSHKSIKEISSPNRNSVIVNLRSPSKIKQLQPTSDTSGVNNEAPNLLSALLSPIPQNSLINSSYSQTSPSKHQELIPETQNRQEKSDDEIYQESLQEFKKWQAEVETNAKNESEAKRNFLKLFDLVNANEKTDIELKVLMSRLARKSLPPIKFRAASPETEKPMSEEVEKQVLIAAFEDPSLKRSNSNPQLTNFMHNLDMKTASKSEKYRREEIWRLELAERMHRFKRGGRRLSGEKRPWDTMTNILKHLNPGNKTIKRRHSLPPISNFRHSRPMRSLSVTLPPDPTLLIGINSSDLLTTVKQNETIVNSDSGKVDDKIPVPCSPVISYPKYVPSYAATGKKSPNGEINVSVLNVPVVHRIFPLSTNHHNENENSDTKMSPTSIPPSVDSIVQRFNGNWKETKDEIEKFVKMKTEKRIPVPELKRLRKALNTQQSEIRAMMKWLKRTTTSE